MRNKLVIIPVDLLEEYKAIVSKLGLLSKFQLITFIGSGVPRFEI